MTLSPGRAIGHKLYQMQHQRMADHHRKQLYKTLDNVSQKFHHQASKYHDALAKHHGNFLSHNKGLGDKISQAYNKSSFTKSVADAINNVGAGAGVGF
jgi:hypothetical protein